MKLTPDYDGLRYVIVLVFCVHVQPVGFVTFSCREDAESARQALQVGLGFL